MIWYVGSNSSSCPPPTESPLPSVPCPERASPACFLPLLTCKQNLAGTQSHCSGWFQLLYTDGSKDLNQHKEKLGLHPEGIFDKSASPSWGGILAKESFWECDILAWWQWTKCTRSDPTKLKGLEEWEGWECLTKVTDHNQGIIQCSAGQGLGPEHSICPSGQL